MRSTHRMPFNTDRWLFHGRPRPSFRRFGLGINGPRTFHWSSLRRSVTHTFVDAIKRCLRLVLLTGVAVIRRRLHLQTLRTR